VPAPTDLPGDPGPGRDPGAPIPFRTAPTRAPDDARPDILVVQSIRAGRTEDFEVLYRRHRDWVYRAACRFTGDTELALDVLQDVFAYLLTRLPTLELHARLTTFLYPAIRNLSIEAVRRRARAGGAGEPQDMHECRLRPSPDAPEAQAALAAAVNALPDGHREVVLLRIVDGLGVGQVAAALGIPEGTVKSRLHHALAALRDDARTRRYFDPVS
jgi:RNA polymerase sigma-70 factor (ECF subfamily)